MIKAQKSQKSAKKTRLKYSTEKSPLSSKMTKMMELDESPPSSNKKMHKTNISMARNTRATNKVVTYAEASEVCDMEYYANLARKVKKATTFYKLQDILKDVELLSIHPLHCDFSLESLFLEEDHEAAQLIPEELCHLVACDICANGNCLPRCVSVLAFGCQTFHQAMRIHILKELVQHKELYLDNDYVCRGHHAIADLVTRYIHCSGSWSDISLNDAYEKHVLECKNDGSDMGVFAVAAAATVLGQEVFSAYPTYGGFNVRDDIHRCFLPRTSLQSTHQTPGHIMWSRTDGCARQPKDWAPNHFVVLLPRSQKHCSAGEDSVPPKQLADDRYELDNHLHHIGFYNPLSLFK